MDMIDQLAARSGPAGCGSGIAQAAQRNSEQRIENREKSAVQQPEFSVAQSQVELDLARQDRDDHAID
jgi:hypothetical protein